MTILKTWRRLGILSFILIMVTAAIIPILSRFYNQSPQGEFDRLRSKGDVNFRDNDYISAIHHWNRASQLNPDSAEIHAKLGTALLHFGNFREGMSALNEAVKIDPKAWDVWLKLGALQITSGHFNDAEHTVQMLREGGALDPAIPLLEGDLALAQMQFGEAEIAYSKAISISENFSPALIRLAMCHLVQGKMDSAETLYEKVVSLESKNPVVLLQMVDYLKLKGEHEKAEAILRKAHRIESDDLLIRSRLAEFYFDTGQYEKAEEAVLAVLEQHPEVLSYKQFLIEILLLRNKIDEAKEIIGSIRRLLVEKNPGLLMLVGKIHLLSGEAIQAVSRFHSVVALQPELPQAHYLLGVAYLMNGQINLAKQSFAQALSRASYHSDSELALADIYFKMKEYPKAFEHAKKIIDREPENYRTYLILGNIYLAMEQYEDAMISYAAAQRLSPDAIAPLYYRAVASELSNRPQEASEYYKKALAAEPNLADAGLRLARQWLKAGNIGEATEYFKKISTTHPQNGYVLHILGEISFVAGTIDKAAGYYEKAISLEPNLISSYLRLVEIYESKHEMENQIEILKSCLERFPEFEEGYIKLAQVYTEMNATDEAVKILEKATARKPEVPQLANYLAWIYLEQGVNLEKAFDLAKQAYALLPSDASVADTLGWAYYKKNLFTRAEWILDEARKLEPEHPLIHYHLGLAYEAQGNKELASSTLKKSLALGLKVEYPNEAKRLLKLLMDNDLNRY